MATCRAIVKKYPKTTPREILDGLIATTPDDAGRWFATAKTLGFLDLAAELAHRSPVDIATLLHAARDHSESNPEFALSSASAALHWMAQGRYYEITAESVWQARDYALQAAVAVGRVDPTRALIDQLIASIEIGPFVRQHLSARARVWSCNPALPHARLSGYTQEQKFHKVEQ